MSAEKEFSAKEIAAYLRAIKLKKINPSKRSAKDEAAIVAGRNASKNAIKRAYVRDMQRELNDSEPE